MATQKYLFTKTVGMPQCTMYLNDYMEFDDVNHILTMYPANGDDKVVVRFDPDQLATLVTKGWIAVTGSTPGGLPGDITTGGAVSLGGSLPAGSNLIGSVTSAGPVGVGVAVAGNNPVLMGGSDGTLARIMRTDANGYQMGIITNGTQNMPTMDAAARRGFFTHTDGTNSMPTGDTVARGIYHRITDGVTQVNVKAASTAAVAADPALVVALSPNNNVIANSLFTKISDGTTTAKVAPASTPPVTADTALTVALSPNMAVSAYALSAAATTNPVAVKASAGTLFSITCSNTAAATNYLKLYNKATAPTVGTDVPVLTIAIPTNGTVALNLGTLGYRFTTGIGIATTVSAADSATDVLVAANTMKIALSYN